ncbi:Phytochrome-like protein cph2 [Planctomycetes bacterium CA13]|uniref:Phytochrome-like protein cph2 n=1 Tax=Novipirellula herctigrandis TaxID=2527986 RepID=A0A5C5YYF7_9BACT|nr:Phytochrome-like protein cph2 [Planctomycetes bacterium CA13]
MKLPTEEIPVLATEARSSDDVRVVSNTCMRQNSEPSSGLVLIVDDERINQQILARLLSKKGYQTVLASDGMEALQYIEELPIDIVLLDIVMPVLDGSETLRRLRKKRSEVVLPVIMVTGDGDKQQVVRALNDGANDFITKPIDPDVTIARLEMQMKLRSLQSALFESEQRYALASQGANDGLWDWELITNEVYFSPRWKQMLGIDEALVLDSSDDWLGRTHLEDRARIQRELECHLLGEIPHFEAELRMLHCDGSYRWMLCRGLAVRDKNGKATRIAGSLTDITEGKVADSLTGLPNRLLFRDRLQGTIDRVGLLDEKKYAVLYLDLDNFKLVNDSLGHAAGDQLLVLLAKRLESCVCACESIVARIGGDEFAILLESVKAQCEAEKVAQRVTEAILTPFTLGDGREVFTSASIGISYVSDRNASADDLLREADTAMYEAKQHGKSHFEVFDPTMHESARARLDLECELRRSIDRDELYLCYQPIVEMASGALIGFEALARWNHPRLGQVSPEQFIPIAEDTGLIGVIGSKLLRMACRQMETWKASEKFAAELSVNFNLSAKQMSQNGLADDIRDSLSESSLSPDCLRVEITESAIMENLHEGVELLCDLRESGIRVEIDDFGTGYSSLALLHKLPLDVLKIDRSFIRKMLTSTENIAIVRTILTLADSLNLDVIAEGIETEEQRGQLLEMGCELGQGYLFSKPLDCVQIEHLICQACTWKPQGQRCAGGPFGCNATCRFPTWNFS